jgi:GTPase SAR1 family protein
VYKFLVGNKCDMEDKRKVSYEQGKEFADTYGMKFIETSAKNSINVEEAFVTMTKEIIKQNVEKEKVMAKSGIIFYLIKIYIKIVDDKKEKNKVDITNKNSKNLKNGGG